MTAFRGYAQLGVADPDSVLAEWLESADWEGVSLHPDIAMDWLLDMDSSYGRVSSEHPVKVHLITVNMPVGAAILDWTSDSGAMISPVSMKYRLKVSDSRRWEFRLQTTQAAGDTCLTLPKNGMPEHLSQSLLIRPGELFREIIIGDYQVSSGYGAVAGSGPVFSVALGNPGSLSRVGKGIRSYSGSAEGRFLRGVAGNINFGSSEVFLYGSGKVLGEEGVAGFGFKRSYSTAEIGLTGIMTGSRVSPVVKEGWTSAWQPDSDSYSRLGVWGQARVPFGIAFCADHSRQRDRQVKAGSTRSTARP